MSPSPAETRTRQCAWICGTLTWADTVAVGLAVPLAAGPCRGSEERAWPGQQRSELFLCPTAQLCQTPSKPGPPPGGRLGVHRRVLLAAQGDQPRGREGLCSPLWDWALERPIRDQCPGQANNAPLPPRLLQNGSKDNSLDMLGTDIWAANTFDSFR